MLKKLQRQVDDEGEKFFDAEKLTFNDIADYYEKHFCHPAEYSNNRLVSGLCNVGGAKGVLKHFPNYFGSMNIHSITYGYLLSYKRMTDNNHTKRPRSISTMNMELSILRRIFKIALTQDWLLKNSYMSSCKFPVFEKDCSSL